jgi:hypothetical protein
MENGKPTIRIELTEQQRQKLKELSGQDVAAIELNVDELEQRIAPACASGRHFPGVGL